MDNSPLQLFLVALLFLIINLLQNSYAAKNYKGFSLKMIPRDSLESPLYRANLTENEKFKEYIKMSNSRVHFIARLTKNTSALRSRHPNDVIIRPTVGEVGQYYHVQVGIGTFNENPKYKFYYLGLDTGSDLSWTQCEGCQSCFQQADPYFPASESQSYKPLSCNPCPSGADCVNGKCILKREYGDGATLEAIAATETFTFQSIDKNFVALSNIRFGCGKNMQNFKEGDLRGNVVSGLLGMGYGDYSFLDQVYYETDGRFSYCFRLPSEYRSDRYMKLRFGSDVIQVPRMKSTPLQQNGDLPMYYLTLQGISVANKRLAVGPSLFQLKADGSGGCIIDSGATVSYVVSAAYEKLITAVSKTIEAKNTNVRRIAQPKWDLKLCYERIAEPSIVNLPVITFHFANNADFDIQPASGFYDGTSSYGKPVYCLMIQEAAEDDNGMSTLGAYQQMNQRIIYDVLNSNLLFGPADCSTAN